MGAPGGQLRNEIDDIIFNRKYCLTDVSTFPSLHKIISPLKVLILRGQKPQVSRRGVSGQPSPGMPILLSIWEDTVMENIDDDYDRFVHNRHDSTERGEGL